MLARYFAVMQKEENSMARGETPLRIALQDRWEEWRPMTATVTSVEDNVMARQVATPVVYREKPQQSI